MAARDLRTRVLLVAILASALLLRLQAVTYGIPYIYEWDEPSIMNAVVGMLQRGDWSPRFYIYPPLYLYLQLVVAKLHYWVLHLTGVLASPAAIEVTPPDGTAYFWYINMPAFYVWGRMLTVGFGLATVYLLFHLGRRIYGRTEGLLAAALLAAAPGAVYFAGTLRTDVPLAFMVVLATVLSLNILERGETRDYLLAGVAAGLAVATKYNGFWIAAAAAIAHMLATRRVFDRNLLVFGGGLATGVIIGFPELVFRPAAIWRELEAARFFRPGRLLGTLAPYARYMALGLDWFWFIPRHVGFGLVPAVAAVVGAVAGWHSRWRAHALLLSFLLPYLGLITTQGYVSFHYMMPALPLLALFAARGAVLTVSLLGAVLPKQGTVSWLAFGIVAVVLLAAPVGYSARLAAQMRRPDSRVLAAGWLRRHVPAGATVAVAEDLHWFLAGFRDAPFRVVVATRPDENPGWMLHHNVRYYVAPQSRNPFADFPPVAVFPGDPRSAPPPDSNPNLVPMISPAVVIRDVSTILPADPVSQVPQTVSRDRMIAEPAYSPAPGTIAGRIHLPTLRLRPGRYQVSISGSWGPPSWLPPFPPETYRVRVIAGERVVGEFAVDTQTSGPLIASFDVPSAQAVPLRLEMEVQGSVWALRPGREQCAAVPDSPTLNPQQFTLEAWIFVHTLHRVTTVNDEHETRILAKNAERGYTLRIEGQRVPETWKLELGLAGQWSVARGSSSIASVGPEGVVPLGRWTHVAATADGRMARLYIDGVAVDMSLTLNPSGAYTGPHHGEGVPLLIGCPTSELAWFDGMIASVRVWNYARSGDQIRGMMAVQPPEGEPGLVGAWVFDRQIDGRIPDRSGAGNHILGAGSLALVKQPISVPATGSLRAPPISMPDLVSVTRVSP